MPFRSDWRTDVDKSLVCVIHTKTHHIFHSERFCFVCFLLYFAVVLFALLVQFAQFVLFVLSFLVVLIAVLAAAVVAVSGFFHIIVIVLCHGRYLLKNEFLLQE